MPDGSFFHRYINDAYRFLPEEDRAFLTEFWTAMMQAAGNVQQALLEAGLGRYRDEQLTFAVDRWARYSFGIASVSTEVVSEGVTFTDGLPVTLDNQTLLSFGLLLTRDSDGLQYVVNTDFVVNQIDGTITRPAGSSILFGTACTLRYTHITTAPVVAGYPYVMSVDSNVVSIPILQDEITVTSSTTVLYENVDFVVGNGFLSFAAQPPPHMWAEKTLVDDEEPYARFGVLVDYYLANSPQYVQALRGLYFAYFRGSQVETIENAVRLMLGLPSALRDGTVTQVLDELVTVQIDTVAKPYTIVTTGITSEVVANTGGVITGGALTPSAISLAPVAPDSVSLSGDVAVAALDTGSAGGAAAGAVPVSLGGPVKALTPVTLTIVGTTITISGDGTDLFIAAGGTLTIDPLLCTIDRSTGAISIEKTDAANDSGSNFIATFTGEIVATAAASGAITGTGITGGSVDGPTGAFTGLTCPYDDTLTPGAVTHGTALQASFRPLTSILSNLRVRGVVRVGGIGNYTGALKVASVSGDTVVLAADALDDYDSASPPVGVDPTTVTLTVPRQVGYLTTDNVLRYEEIFTDLVIDVALGEEVTRYQPFTTGTQVIDKVVNPNFVFDEVGRAGIQRFLTDAATVGPAPTTDESIAMDTLRSHLWVMQIHGAVFNYIIGLEDVVEFLEKIKPQYTEYILQILQQFDEPVAIAESEEKEIEKDLTYTVNSNTPNVEVFAVQAQVVSFIQATRIITISAPHDFTVFGAVGETVILDGFGADDGAYTIETVIDALNIRVSQVPSANHPAPLGGTERIYVMGTDEEYTAAGGYPYLNVGAGHPYIDETAEADVDFEAELHEIRVLGGPTYFLDSNPADPTHFTLWGLDVGVDQVTVAGAANGVNNAAWTVLEVMSDATLRIDGGGGPVIAEGAGIGGTITISKTLPL